MDVNTLSIIELDRIAYEVLELYGRLSNQEIVERLKCRHKRNDLKETIYEIKALQEQGLITAQQVEDMTMDGIPAQELSSITLHVISGCNLRCRYCFGQDGTYGMKSVKMDRRIARKAVDLLFRQSGRRARLHVVFFGGEPMLNMPLIEDVVKYSAGIAREQKKTVSFSITTNATLLDDHSIQYLNDHKIGVLVSMDGPREVQDSLRCFANGNGSYERVIQGLRKFIDSRKGKVSVRATVTKLNTGIREIHDHFGNIGFGRAHFVPVDIPGGSELSLNGGDFQKVEREFRKISRANLRAASGKHGIVLGNLRDVVERLHQRKKRLLGCGLASGFAAICPVGNIYPCHRFVGMEQFIIGDIESGIDPERRQNFLKRVLGHVSENCGSCWLRFLCAGGCLKEAMDESGDFVQRDENYCRLIKTLYQLGIVFYARFQKDARVQSGGKKTGDRKTR
ncbi:SPASM domain-containing protein [candidate division WOR-3 bacterium]|nr:SPASM domain-containing protein [candidate division WOR-3 bacterium]